MPATPLIEVDEFGRNRSAQSLPECAASPATSGSEPSALADLLARVEAAEGADTTFLLDGLHDRIWRCVNDNKWNDAAPGWEYDLHLGPDFTGSIDAALALCERVLPGYLWDIVGPGLTAIPTARLYAPECVQFEGGANTPALALLAAMLKAKIAEAASPGEGPALPGDDQ